MFAAVQARGHALVTTDHQACLTCNLSFSVAMKLPADDVSAFPSWLLVQGIFHVRALDRFANAVPLASAAATGPRAFQATLAAAGADPQPLALSLSGAPGAPDP